jgi:hypothetical protein
MVTKTAPGKALVAAQPLSNEDLMALLQQSGMVSSGGTEYHRITILNGMLVSDPGTDKEEKYPPTDRGRGPAMRVRIVSAPVYYNQFFLSEDESRGGFDARKIGRGDLNGRSCRKYDDAAEQANDQYAHLDAYEQVSSYLTNERGSQYPIRGQFRADLQVQIMPDDGQFKGDETIYTLSLSTTGALDFRGTTKNPSGGVVQDKNFIVQLGEFAIAEAAANDKDPRLVVVQALEALRLGNVVADIYLMQSSNPENGNVWTVPAFKPVFVDFDGEAPALTTGGAVNDTTTDEIPF